MNRHSESGCHAEICALLRSRRSIEPGSEALRPSYASTMHPRVHCRHRDTQVGSRLRAASDSSMPQSTNDVEISWDDSVPHVFESFVLCGIEEHSLQKARADWGITVTA